MSGTFPTSPNPRSIKLTSIEPTVVSTAHSLRKIRRSRGTQRWKLEVGYPPMRRSALAPILAFAMLQQGQAETFDFIPYTFGTPQGTTGSDNPVVDGAHTAGDTTIATKTWTGSTLVLKAGDLVRFAGHAKTYMVSADATTDGAGLATLAIRPALIEDLADNAALTVRDVPIQCTFASDSQEVALTSTDVFGFGVDLVETL